MNDRARWMLVAGFAVLALVGSYCLALLGEPQSAWVWSLAGAL